MFGKRRPSRGDNPMNCDRLNQSGRFDRPGAAAVEFAIVLPVFVTLLFGIWEVGRLVQVSQVLQNAAREAARQASSGTVTLTSIKTNVQSYIQGADPRIANFTGFDVKFANLTNSAVTDPTNCIQLDKFKITVTLPFDNVRWSLSKMFTPAGSQVQTTVTWYCMKDLPVSVSTTLPVE
jgi:Flp pilus assembly protein TadG